MCVCVCVCVCVLGCVECVCMMWCVCGRMCGVCVMCMVCGDCDILCRAMGVREFTITRKADPVAEYTLKEDQ